MLWCVIILQKGQKKARDHGRRNHKKIDGYIVEMPPLVGLHQS
jgi:hypothetical protein